MKPIITTPSLVSIVFFCSQLTLFMQLTNNNYAIFSAGVCDAAPRTDRWTLKIRIHVFFSVSLASVCKGAKADVVFLIDGSWSIGEESFTKVVHFVKEMIGAFDVIGPSGMQVCTEG